MTSWSSGNKRAATVITSNRAVAACTIGGPTGRIRAHLRRLAAEVKTAAHTISRLLGCREPRDARGDGAQDTGASRGARHALPRRRR